MYSNPPLVTPFTVVNSMTVCGLSAQGETMFDTEIFMDNFKTCREISNKDIHDDLNNSFLITVV